MNSYNDGTYQDLLDAIKARYMVPDEDGKLVPISDDQADKLVDQLDEFMGV